MPKEQVLIVGAGPIGSFLAVDLARQDIPVKIIDKIPQRTSFTKALTINSSTLKVLQGVDMAETFLKHGKVLTDAEAYYNGRLITHLNKKYLDSAHNYFLSIPQPITEKLLHDKLATYGIKVDYQQELTAIKQSKDCATATIKNLKNNKSTQKQFSFIIGCDGAHSTVRELIGLSFKGHTYDMYFVVADVFFEDNCRVEKSSYFIDDTGFIGTFLMRDDGCTRLVIKKEGFMPRDKPETTKEEMQAYLDEHLINKPLKIKEMVWSAGAQIITRVTESGHVNRTFLAGDSYHLFSPVGGHNMNTGFQDTFNLAWKLSYYLKGWAKEDILDSYSQERGIAIKKLLEVTDINTNIVMRRNKTDKRIDQYTPKLSNRHYYRNAFPHEFAGYFADHNTDTENLVGKHIPYMKFSSSYFNVASSYGLPMLQKFVLFHLDNFSDADKLNKLGNYQHLLNTIKLSPQDSKHFKTKLQLDNSTICIMRPDGYVGFHGSVDKAVAYFQAHHIAKAQSTSAKKSAVEMLS